ncbi:MAG: glucokinase [Candidatus Promineifilaceae bacterium]|nr:glucokinase [Candidatus Promineifilaceae bacterium]
MLLSGDIGGTKTVLALFEEEGSAEFKREPLREEVFSSGEYYSLEEIIREFLGEGDNSLSGASFGVAGPVVNQQAEVTNLPWKIDAKNISKMFGVETRLLNDLEAIANAVPYLGPEDLIVLHEGQPEPHGAKAVIAPGTGLGEAFLVWDGQQYESYPSEGGHAAFAPTSSRQIDLLSYWIMKLGHVSYERLCSGIGIPNIYQYLSECGEYEEPDWLRAELIAAKDPTPLIVNTAKSGKAGICVDTLNLFMEILGGEAANLALKVLATGGVYVGGGIPPRIIPQLQASRFMDLFRYKGRFSEMMAKMPVYIINNPKVALYGAAYEALKATHHEPIKF